MRRSNACALCQQPTHAHTANKIAQATKLRRRKTEIRALGHNHSRSHNEAVRGKYTAAVTKNESKQQKRRRKHTSAPTTHARTHTAQIGAKGIDRLSSMSGAATICRAHVGLDSLCESFHHRSCAPHVCSSPPLLASALGCASPGVQHETTPPPV